MGRVCSPDYRESKRNNFRLAMCLYHASLLKVAALALVEAKRRLVGG